MSRSRPGHGRGVPARAAGRAGSPRARAGGLGGGGGWQAGGKQIGVAPEAGCRVFARNS